MRNFKENRNQKDTYTCNQNEADEISGKHNEEKMPREFDTPSTDRRQERQAKTATKPPKE